jgi:glutaconate CoA-transferase, subunit A
MFLLGLQAACWRVPYLPTRVGLGSDLFRDNPKLRTVRSPYRVTGPGALEVLDDPAEGEELVAAPAITLDAAFVHLNRADPRGNAGYLGPDPYFDDLFVGAAERAFVSAERIVPTEDLQAEVGLQRLLISRLQVDGVIEAPGGAHFTSCVPDEDRDETFQKAYAASAKSPRPGPTSRSRGWTCPRPTTSQAPIGDPLMTSLSAFPRHAGRAWPLLRWRSVARTSARVAR